MGKHGRTHLFFSSIKNRILVFVVVFEITAYGTIQLFNNYIYKNELLDLKDAEIAQTVAASIEKIKNISQLMERNVMDLAMMGERLYALKQNNRLDISQMKKQSEKTLVTNFSEFSEAIGGGLWYEPYALDSSIEYFGPYAFRDKHSVVFSWDLNTPEYDYPSQPWYAVAEVAKRQYSPDKRSIFWTEPYFDQAATFSLMMTVDAVMFDDKGQGIGMATVDWSLQQLTDSLDKVKASPNAFPFFIYQGQGKFLSYPKDKARVLTSAGEFPWGKRLLANRETGKLLTLYDVAVDAEKYNIYYYRTERGFIFGLLMPVSDNLQAIGRITTVTLMAGLTIGLAFILLMILLMRLLFTPFDQVLGLIRGSIVRNGGDDRQVMIRPIHYPANNEFTPIIEALGDIYRQVNAYLDLINGSRAEIESLNKELEAKVVERTRQLEHKTNEAIIALEKLQQTQLHLVETEKHAAMGRLVAGVAHEINSPLGVSVTAASCISRELVETMEGVLAGRLKRSQLQQAYAEMQKGLQILNDNLARASDLVTSFKQIAVDQNSEAFRSIELDGYIDSVLCPLRTQIDAGKHQLIFHCEPGLEIHSHPGSLAQVVTQLVENALQHGFEQRTGGTIDINISHTETGVELRVSDDGKGMQDTVLESIFEPFFTTSRHSGNCGLGLHLLYNLVTQTLGGTISCHSVEGKGTIFLVDLPEQAVRKES